MTSLIEVWVLPNTMPKHWLDWAESNGGKRMVLREVNAASFHPRWDDGKVAYVEVKDE